MNDVRVSEVLDWARSKLGKGYGWTSGRGPTYGCNDYVIAALWNAGAPRSVLTMMQVEDICRSKLFETIPVSKVQPGDFLTYINGNGTDSRRGARDHIQIVEDPKKRTVMHAKGRAYGIRRDNYDPSRVATALRFKGIIQDVLAVPGADRFAFRKNIRLGDDAYRVALLRELMGLKGRSTIATKKLIDKVIKKQTELGLEPDGIVGPITWAAFRKAYGR